WARPVILTPSAPFNSSPPRPSPPPPWPPPPASPLHYPSLPTARYSPLATTRHPRRLGISPSPPATPSGEAMAAVTARAPAVDKRYRPPAASAPKRTPAVGALGTAPKPTNQSARRGALLWDDRPRPPAPNPWASSLFFSLKNDGGSGSFGNINDHPSFGSSRMSTDGSDLLDSSLAWGQTSHNSTTAKSHPQSTELTSGSGQLPHSQTSFLDVLKAQLKTSTSRVCTRYSIHDVSCYGKYSSGSITFRKHLLVGAYQDC
ncbi:unnamed protein product, partial [Urochloa humidicola]